jgi:hypothetical protein
MKVYFQLVLNDMKLSWVFFKIYVLSDLSIFGLNTTFFSQIFQLYISTM